MVAVNLAPAEVDVQGVRAGDRNLFALTVRVAGSAMDLTGYTVTAHARTKADVATSLEAVCTITDAAAGKIDVRWPGEAVRTWLDDNITQKGVWDLQLAGGTGDPWTIVTGDFTAELDVTHV